MAQEQQLIVQKCVMFDKKFSHFAVYVREADGTVYYIRHRKKRLFTQLDVHELFQKPELTPVIVPTWQIYPWVPLASQIKWFCNRNYDVHVKRTNFQGWAEAYDDEKTDIRKQDAAAAVMKKDLEHEIAMCSLLQANPHPNIAQFLGLHCYAGQVEGLCFRKYEITLEQRIRSGDRPYLDTALLYEGIEAGIKHLHDLGYCHNDLNAHHIMLDNLDHPYIIDFSKIERRGKRLRMPNGTPGFMSENYQYSLPSNDRTGIMRISTFIRETREQREREHILRCALIRASTKLA